MDTKIRVRKNGFENVVAKELVKSACWLVKINCTV
jgi:hypothetical protein